MSTSGERTTRLVADIGGTNTRIALFDPEKNELRALSTYVNREFGQLEDVIARWLDGLAEPAPTQCCIAVAAPPSGDRVRMSNMHWTFSCRELAARFGFTRMRRINDFEAVAYALPHLADGDRSLLYPGHLDHSGRLAAVGAGTGLGGAVLGWSGTTPVCYPSEPGYMGLAPGNALELEIFRLLLPRHGSVYAELLVSGPGLSRLHQALAEIRGEPTEALGPGDISREALAGGDNLCVQALTTFCALLGSICGDFLLANGAYGGLFLAGGIIPRVMDFLTQSTFRQRLVDKGAMSDQLARVPVSVITADQPGLIGASHVPA